MFNKNRSNDHQKRSITRRSCIAKELAESSEISIRESTKQELERFGQMNESYDLLISKMLDHINTCDKWWENRI